MDNTARAYEKNASFSFKGEPEKIDVEKEINNSAGSMSYDPYKLAGILKDIGQKMIGVKLYTYQEEPSFRIIYSILARDGAEITLLYARQSGKSEVVTFCAVTLGILLPVIAKIFPKELGHFKTGVKMGLLAPQSEQVQTIYSRCMERLLSEHVKIFLDDPDILDNPLSTVHFKLKSGSFLTGQSAAKQSKIESKTYHIVFMDEAQDIDTEKVRRCVAEGSMIPTPDGYFPIEQVVKEKLEVLSPTHGYVYADEYIDNGVQKCFDVTLENGESIRVTENHKNRIKRKSEIYNEVTSNLVIGDKISTVIETAHYGKKYTYNEGVLCGYILGGRSDAGENKLICFDDTVARLPSLLVGFNVKTSISRVNKINGLTEVRFPSKVRSTNKDSNDLVKCIRKVYRDLYGKGCKNADIKGMSKEFLKGFIEGLIEIRGEIKLPHDKQGSIHFYTNMGGLAHILSKALRVFGIQSKVTSNKELIPTRGRYSLVDTLSITKIESIKAFKKNISLWEKEELLNLLSDRCKNYKEEGNEWERFENIVSIKCVGNKNTYCVSLPTDDKLWVVDTIITHNSIMPMLASTFGTAVRTGTPGRNKGDFYHTIKANEKSDRLLKTPKEKQTKQAHFQYDYREVIASKKLMYKKDNQDFHLLYAKSVERDRKAMGDNSDFFRLAYKVEWILEVGMFITDIGLEESCFNKRITFPTIEVNKDFIVAGLDIASARNDTVLTIGRVDQPAGDFGERPIKVLCKWVVLKGMNYEEQFQLIAEELLHNGVRVLYSDYTGVGRGLTDVLMYHLSEYLDIVPFTFTPSSKSDMWKALDEDINNGKLVVPAHKSVKETPYFSSFVEQMTNLQKYWKGSYMVCEKSSGYSDDFCDSFALMNLAGNHLYSPSMEVEITENTLVETHFRQSMKNRSKW